MTTPEERIAVLEIHVENMQDMIRNMSSDVRTIRDTLSAARGGWRTLMLIAGVSGSIGAFLVKAAPFFFVR